MRTPLVLLLAGLTTLMPGRPDAPIAVEVRATVGPIFVGQAIEIEVEAEANTIHPTFETPQPLGEVVVTFVEQVNARVARYVVLPRKPGLIEIPPFRVREEGRVGTSRRVPRTVNAIPGAGRTSAFLGGVGSFEIRGSIEPPAVQAGQPLEFQIHLTGPAAWGSEQPPDLSAWASKVPGLRVEPLTSVLTTTSPPSRTFRYRLRPLTPGKVILPPVAVAAFDPSSKTFRTRVTTRLVVEVAAPPMFDPETIDNGGHSESKTPFPWVGVGRGVLIVLAGLSVWVIRRRFWIKKKVDPRRLATDLADSLDPHWSDREAARPITEGFAAFLQSAWGRNPGVLTPAETVDAFARLTGDVELAESAGRLIERCDRFNYGGIESDEASLVQEAKGVLRDLVGIKSRAGKERGEQPREAVETV